MRVGVTGHRTFDGGDEVARQVDAVLDRLWADHGPIDRHPTHLDPTDEVWSALAEGADRMVAERLLARGAVLVALLPLEPDDYRDDFGDPASVAEFDRLLGAATEVRVARPSDPTREAAYEAAGLEMLDAVDVLVALWDGAPQRGRGGTGAIVAEARRRGLEVIVVPVTRDNVG